MPRVPLALLALAVACAPAGEKMADTPGAAAMPASISLADVAGTWTMRIMPENSDSVVATAELNATADAAGWTMILAGRPPLPMRVTVDGDSIMSEVGPYESVLRPGVQVTTNGVMRLEGGVLRGRTVAHYRSAGADSVVTFRSEATRK
ncbi:MAG: hypothetical protein ACT4R6_00075 [Gemmatimonadaceae bacterium]